MLTRLEELQQRALPYAYILPPHSVIDWSIDAKDEFNWVKVVEEVPKDAGNFLQPNDKETYYRIWTKDEYYLFDDKENLVKRGEHGLGVVPFILLQNRKGPLGSIIGRSEIHDIAKIGKRLYNLCSELDDLLRSQTFATLTYPALDAKDLSDVELGTDRILTYDPSSSFAPTFIAPSSDATKAYETRIAAIIEEIYRLARLNYKGGVTQSGIALSFMFEKTNQALSDKALNMQEAERRIAKVVCKWQESDFEGEIQYPLDYSVSDVEKELKMALDAIKLDISDRFNIEYKKSTARKLLPKLPESIKSVIDGEIRSAANKEPAISE
ncbi:phage portal protein [Thermodesulfobacteriota bacterium]